MKLLLARISVNQMHHDRTNSVNRKSTVSLILTVITKNLNIGFMLVACLEVKLEHIGARGAN